MDIVTIIAGYLLAGACGWILVLLDEARRLKAATHIATANAISQQREIERLRAIVSEKATAIRSFDHDGDGKPGGGRRRQTI